MRWDGVNEKVGLGRETMQHLPVFIMKYVQLDFIKSALGLKHSAYWEGTVILGSYLYLKSVICVLTKK